MKLRLVCCRRMRTFWWAWEAPSSLTARRRESTKCSSPWESVSNLVIAQFDDIKHAFWWGWKVLKVVTQLWTIKTIKIANFMTIAIVHTTPHTQTTWVENSSLENLYYHHLAVAICWSHQWLFSNYNRLSKNRKAKKNNKSIKIPWVRNVIYVVNNPEIPFVHLPRQLNKDNCTYNGRKLRFSEKNLWI